MVPSRAGALASALVLTACSEATTYGVGPAFVAGDGRRDLGLVVETSSGSGRSSETSTVLLDARARALVTSHQQQVAGLVGVSSYRWASRSELVSFGLGAGLGFERAYDKAFFLPLIGQVRAGSAFVLASAEKMSLPLFGLGRGCMQRSRESTLLSLGLAADVDTRFTRDPYVVVQLQLGLVFLTEEGLPSRLPRLPPPFAPALADCP